MFKRVLIARVLRAMTAIAAGGTAFQLGNCDPGVRDVLLGGLQTTSTSLADTIIQAFFVSIQDEEGAAAGGSTTGLTTT